MYSLNGIQIALKTVATTLNLFVLFAIVKGNKGGKVTESKVFNGYLLFMLLNLTGIWI